MADTSLKIIDILRQTADRIKQSSSYQWGHMGSCNCGFLAQQITHQSKDDIHRRAMQSSGDWSEQLNDYCAASGLPMDELVDEIIDFGFTSDDLKHLERLSEKRILNELPAGRRYLTHNVKDDVVLYLNTWASLLEKDFVNGIVLNDLPSVGSVISVRKKMQSLTECAEFTEKIH